MPSQKGRDLLLKIGNGATPAESFTTIGAARTAALTINNQPVDSTSMDGSGIQSMIPDAGVQTMQIRLEGLFKDSPPKKVCAVPPLAERRITLSSFFQTATNTRQPSSSTTMHAAVRTTALKPLPSR
jgi:hypothetical protein